MSQTNEAATTETVTLTREDGTQYTEAPFSLKSTKEIADRFRGDHTILIPLPVAAPGDRDQTLRNIAAFCDPMADLSEILIAKFNGQGVRLDIQKEVKDFLAPRETTDTETVEVNGEQVLVREAPVEAVLAAAQQVARDFRLGTPRKKGTGGSKGKVAAAEAKAAQAIGTAVQMYAALPREMRAQYRDALINTGQVTAEQLDAVDAEEQPGPVTGGNKERNRR